MVLTDVRDELKDCRRFDRLNSFRGPFGCCSTLPFTPLGYELAGDPGIRKLSILSLATGGTDVAVDVDILSSGSFSGSGVGGYAPGICSGVVGCEDKGPPFAVGGRAKYVGDAGGESSGAGMSVPAVREKSTGVRERNDLRLLSATMFARLQLIRWQGR
jgi:hypothetical protein